MMGTQIRNYAKLMAANNGVTGSNFVLTSILPHGREINLMVDCGIFKEKKDEKYNDSLIFNPRKIDYAFITHVHDDHIGKLPLLMKQGYRGEVYCSSDSKILAPLVLADSQKIQAINARRQRRPAPYELSHVYEARRRLVSSRYNKWRILDQNVRYMLLGNGHLQGAAMMLINLRDHNGEEVYFLFTGDLAEDNLFFDVPRIPPKILGLPLNIITEATYGDVNSYEEQEPNFWSEMEKLSRTCTTIVIPTFSLGREQEMLYNIKCMQKCRVLSKKIEIDVDGRLGINYTKLFLSGVLNISSHMRDFLPENCNFIESQEERERIMRSSKPKIIITTSGMATHGPAQFWIPHYVSDKSAAIFFTGYCASGTYGRKLLEAEQGEYFFADNGRLLGQKMATVLQTSEFSKHIRADEEIEFLSKFKNIKSITYSHGEPEVKDMMAERTFRELGIRKVGVINRKVGFCIGKYGITKTFETRQ